MEYDVTESSSPMEKTWSSIFLVICVSTDSGLAPGYTVCTDTTVTFISGSKLTGILKYARSPNSTRAKDPIRIVTGLLMDISTIFIFAAPLINRWK
jgi:hypothetical protein